MTAEPPDPWTDAPSAWVAPGDALTVLATEFHVSPAVVARHLRPAVEAGQVAHCLVWPSPMWLYDDDGTISPLSGRGRSSGSAQPRAIVAPADWRWVDWRAGTFTKIEGLSIEGADLLLDLPAAREFLATALTPRKPKPSVMKPSPSQKGGRGPTRQVTAAVRELGAKLTAEGPPEAGTGGQASLEEWFMARVEELHGTTSIPAARRYVSKAIKSYFAAVGGPRIT